MVLLPMLAPRDVQRQMALCSHCWDHHRPVPPKSQLAQLEEAGTITRKQGPFHVSYAKQKVGKKPKAREINIKGFEKKKRKMGRGKGKRGRKRRARRSSNHQKLPGQTEKMDLISRRGLFFPLQCLPFYLMLKKSFCFAFSV